MKNIVKKLTIYAAVGQLYSRTLGLSMLIRNLLANPHVNQVVILAATKADRNAGSSRCLFDFFLDGAIKGKNDINEECWVVNSKHTGFIDKEITKEALDQLRNDVRVVYCETVDALLEVEEIDTKIVREKLIFEYHEPKLDATIPGPQHGHVIRSKSLLDAWHQLVYRIVSQGRTQSVADGFQRREIIDMTVVVEEDFSFPTIDDEFAQSYIDQILNDSQDTTKYTYGAMLRSFFKVDQIEQVIAKLKNEPDSYSAAMGLWDPSFHERGGSPCLNHIWVRITTGSDGVPTITLVATFRSNEMFSAWPANCIGLRALQKYIAERLGGLALGPIVTNSLSAHVDDNSWLHAKKFRPKPGFVPDECGSFVVYSDRIDHVSTEGTFIRSYDNPAQIVADMPNMRADHALWLGAEVQRVHG